MSKVTGFWAVTMPCLSPAITVMFEVGIIENDIASVGRKQPEINVHLILYRL